MSAGERLALLRTVKRVVVKIGSAVLGDGGEPSRATLRRLVGDFCAMTDGGRFEIIIVTSGAVMSGRSYLGLPGGKLSIPLKQAAAAAGQVKLMDLYGALFGERGKKVAQILLTHADIEDEGRKMNARNTIAALLDIGAVPIINENDSTAVDEIKFGDNDTLAAKITSVVGAHLLLILSDVDGLYDSDPRKNRDASLVSEVRRIDETVLAAAGDSSSGSGTGGMRAKITAAKIATDYGVPTWIIGGREPGAVPRALLEGEGGTFLFPETDGLSARRHWILHILKSKGRLVVDTGGRRALAEMGRSLLPSGVVRVEGKFRQGDKVAVADETGTEFACGLVNYDAAELEKIKGRKSSEIEAALGYKGTDEAIHRDDMVIAAPSGAGNKMETKQ